MTSPSDGHAKRGLAGAVIATYEKVAAAWDAGRPRVLFERPSLERFLAHVPVGGTVLDLGCGAGEPIADHILQAGRRVYGVDAAGPMIAICRERFPDARWAVADMRTLDLSERFDGIIAWDSFFHLTADDQRAMFPVFARHAAPGAPVLITTGPDASEDIGSVGGLPIYHASLAPDEYRSLFAANGLEVLDFRPDDPECDFHSVWLAQRAGG